MLCFGVVLAGCSGTGSELDRAMTFRDRLLDAGECSFQAEVTADYGDSLYTFSVTCSGNAMGDLTFCITEPELLKGITGIIEASGGEIRFDDVALAFPLLTDKQLTPVSAPWIFLKTLRSGRITAAAQEEGNLHLTMDDSYAEDALQVDIWLDGDSKPIRGDILYAGKRFLSLHVKDFILV